MSALCHLNQSARLTAQAFREGRPRGEQLERTQEESSSPIPRRPVVPGSALDRVASRVPTALSCCDSAS
jgi:hypothetical protein